MKSIGRWKLAQRIEVGVYPPKTSYTEEEAEQVQRRLSGEITNWESYVEERTGVKPADMRTMCVMEIGGVLFADQLLFQSKALHKLILDPLIRPRMSDDCEFVRGVAEYIPQKSSTLRVCWMTNTIDHCADPLLALEEVRRVLTDNGRLYITCNTFTSWTRPLFPAFDRLDGPHPHHFTRSSLLSLLTKAGFTVEAEIPPWTPPLRGWNQTVRTVKVLLGRMCGLTQIKFRCRVAKSSS